MAQLGDGVGILQIPSKHGSPNWLTGDKNKKSLNTIYKKYVWMIHNTEINYINVYIPR